MILTVAFISLFASQTASAGASRSQDTVAVAKGIYIPFFRDVGESDQTVGPVEVDRYPVTNAQYREFVRRLPQYRRSKIARLFADDGYLADWKSDLKFGRSAGRRPVTNVSWFAAKRYCENKGKRLLTVAEWEFVSNAGTQRNQDLILDWYSHTTSELPFVTKAPVNERGIAGMHGLIWEWVEDFSSVLLVGDSRSSNETSAAMFCGSGSLRAKDPSQYATFMRFAFRSSLRARSVGQILGFRCARTSHSNPKEI